MDISDVAVMTKTAKELVEFVDKCRTTKEHLQSLEQYARLWQGILCITAQGKYGIITVVHPKFGPAIAMCDNRRDLRTAGNNKDIWPFLTMVDYSTLVVQSSSTFGQQLGHKIGYEVGYKAAQEEMLNNSRELLGSDKPEEPDETVH